MQVRETEEKTVFKKNLPIQGIIDHACRNFKEGRDIRDQFKKDFIKFLDGKPDHSDDVYYYSTKKNQFSRIPEATFKKVHVGNYYDFFPRLIDENVSSDFNATYIKGTNFIAASGPKDNDDLEKFFKDTAFHSTHPIQHFVALGELIYCVDEKHGRSRKNVGGDFLNYFMLEGEKETRNYKITMASSSAKIIKGRLSEMCEDFVEFNTEYNNPIAENKLHITNKTTGIKRDIVVNAMMVPDNTCIKLGLDDGDEMREWMWKILFQSMTDKVLVHCASGIGRTGHLIATLLFLKAFDEIFEADNVSLAAQKVIEIVKCLRQDRFCLINTKEQLERALMNALILHNYGEQLGYPQQLKELINQSKLKSLSTDDTRFFKTKMKEQSESYSGLSLQM